MQVKADLLADPAAAGKDDLNFAIAHINDAINLIANYAEMEPDPESAEALKARIEELEAERGIIEAPAPQPLTTTVPEVVDPPGEQENASGLRDIPSAEEAALEAIPDAFPSVHPDAPQEAPTGSPEALMADQARARGRAEWEGERQSDVDRPVGELNK